MNPEEFTVRRLTSFSQVETLYRTRLKKDFAPAELRPLSSLRRSWERNAYDCFGLFAADELLGYAFFARLEKSYLLDYFAVAADRRGEGLGSLFLGRLAEIFRDADCVLCEAEDPDRASTPAERASREQRLRFYLRLGWRLTELRCVLFGVDYRLLELPAAGSHTEEELLALYCALYRGLLPPYFFRTQFHPSRD